MTNSTIYRDTNPSGCALIDQFYCHYDDECVEDCKSCTAFTLARKKGKAVHKCVG